MYTRKPLPPLPDALHERGWASGMIHRCAQQALDFGSDRKVPVPTRPVAELHREPGRSVVLPCTSQDRRDDPRFFAFDPQRLRWLRQTAPDQRTFAYERYEVVPVEALQKKIGIMEHSTRLTLLQWVKDRY